MTRATKKWGAMVLAAAALVGCGGGNDGGSSAAGATATAAGIGRARREAHRGRRAAGERHRDQFVVGLHGAAGRGVPAVIVTGPPKVNFAVFSDGAVKTDLTLADVSFAIAKLVPGTNGDPDQWVSYVYRTEVADPGRRARAARRCSPAPCRRPPTRSPRAQPRTSWSSTPRATTPTRSAPTSRTRRRHDGRGVRAEPHAPRRDPAQLRQRRRRDGPRQSVLRRHLRRQRQLGAGHRPEQDARDGRRVARATAATRSWRCTAAGASTCSTA